METRAPAVVAVVVTTGPAPGLEPTLTTLAGQDYEELSVLVVANGPGDDIPARVAAVAPDALVMTLEENRGFAAACNEAALAVAGAAFLAFCHDDVLFFEGSLRALVEAAFRANAGIVTPKVVVYEDPFVLLHVGQMADRFGAVRERIEAGEIDHGQHDLERDVFVAPGGVTLVRTDLFNQIHGFDPMIPALGEDLDLCWRAQIAGARIIVAPSAVIAHRETVATGERVVGAVGTRNATRRDLQRRHQLATVLTCTGRLSLLFVVPALLVLDIAEAVVAVLGRDRGRLRSIGGSWRWVLRHHHRLRERRKSLNSTRVLHDHEVARLQVGGASRLKTFFSTLLQDGLDRARGIVPADETERERESYSETIGFAAAFSEDESFDEIAGLEDAKVHRRLGRLFKGARSQLVGLGVLTVMWAWSVRNLLGTTLPIVGRLAPLDSWWTTWRHFFASWSVNGVGTGTPGMPGYAVLAFSGTFTFGRMGVLPKLALIAMVPLGALGIWRLLAGIVSNRARLLGVAAYLAFPLGANLIESGRIDLLVISAIMPFAARRALALLDVPGFRRTPYLTHIGFGHRGWGSTRAGQAALLVIQVAAMTAMAPVALVAALVLIGSLVAAERLRPREERARLDRPGALALDLVLGCALLLAPMTFNTVSAGRGALEVFGLPGGAWSAASVSELARGAIGTFGAGWASWMLPVVAVAALVLAREERHGIALRMATVAVAAIALSEASSRHWLASFAPDAGGLEVLVAIAVAVLAAIAVEAIEQDLSSWSFGWHQVAAAVVVAAMAASAIPFVAQSSTGRFNLPAVGTPESVGSLSPGAVGGYRVLWLGDPRVLPVPGWTVAPGLAAATSTDGLPDGATLFSPPDEGAASDLIHAVDLALHGQTVHLGQLLAPSGVSSIVVMSSIAPSLADESRYPIVEPPASLLPSLRRQDDLALTVQSPSQSVFSNSVYHGIVAWRAEPLAAGVTSSDGDSIRGWEPAIDYGTKQGVVRAGTVLAGLAPSDAFALKVNGKDAPRSGSLGWAATYATQAGTARIVLDQLPLNGVLAALTLALWGLLVLGFGSTERVERFLHRRRLPPVLADAPEDRSPSELDPLGVEGGTS
jgi:GT2 family glycosyltransferase